MFGKISTNIVAKATKVSHGKRILKLFICSTCNTYC